jgi:hypothetical protein
MPLWTVTGATVFQHYWAHLTPYTSCICELRKDANMEDVLDANAERH